MTPLPLLFRPPLPQPPLAVAAPSSRMMATSTTISPPTSFIDNKNELGFSGFATSRLPGAKRFSGKPERKIVAVMAPPQKAERMPATTGSVKNAMTTTEKILVKASEKPRLSPGENVWVNVDVLMTHDVGGPGSFVKEL